MASKGGRMASRGKTSQRAATPGFRLAAKSLS
jgi:hypothetical protein